MRIQFLILFSILIVIYKTFDIEGLTNMSQPKPLVILIGDSMLKNDSYVEDGQSVSDLLRSYAPVDIVAQDSAKIQDISQQLHLHQLGSTATVVFSIGGNNILDEIPSYNGADIDNMFDEYKQTILNQQAHHQLLSKHIILCNIYYPPLPIYEKYYLTIAKWNKLLDEFAGLRGFKILNVADIMNNKEDFTNEIEPSFVGGKKMVEALKEMV